MIEWRQIRDEWGQIRDGTNGAGEEDSSQCWDTSTAWCSTQ